MVEAKREDKPDIFKDHEKLLKIWQTERETRNFNTTLVWENIKFFVGLLGGLLGAHMLLLGFLWGIEEKGIIEWSGISFNWFVLVLIVFPAVIAVLSFCGCKDLKMRWQRFLLVVTHLLKLEDLLGMHEDISSKLNHMKDNYLFSDYQKNFEKYDSYDAFREAEMNKPNTYTSMRKVYRLMYIISAILAAMDVYLFLILK